jgi:hypothetical protein
MLLLLPIMYTIRNCTAVYTALHVFEVHLRQMLCQSFLILRGHQLHSLFRRVPPRKDERQPFAKISGCDILPTIGELNRTKDIELLWKVGSIRSFSFSGSYSLSKTIVPLVKKCVRNVYDIAALRNFCLAENGLNKATKSIMI